jgi:hypothetical protein
MSTLSVGTIKSNTSSPPTIQNSSGTEIGTLCRAWVNFNGTTSPGTIKASFNVSSITKNGTGNLTINFTNAMPDVNYTIVFGTTSYNETASTLSGVAVRGATSTGASNKTTSLVQITTGDTNTNTLRDLAEISAVVFR